MTITLVGDQDQLLYRFQGAKPELLTDEIDQYVSSIQTIKLSINYRSQDEIINKAQQLIANNYSDLGGPYPQEFMKDVRGVRGQGEPIQFTMYSDADAEAAGVADTIQEMLQSGYEPGDFFIGARTRAQLGYVEGVLVRAGIKFINITGGSFWQSKHVADVLAYLRLAYLGDKESLKRVYNIPSANNVYAWTDRRNDPPKFEQGEYCPTRFLGNEFLAKIDYDFSKVGTVYRAGKYGWKHNNGSHDLTSGQTDLQDFVWKLQMLVTTANDMGQVIRTIVDDCYERYLRHEGAGDEGLANAKLEDLATVEELASKYQKPEEFLAYVDKNIQAAEDAKNKDWGEYVVLSTIHKLKGLERKVVFGLGWCEGIDLNSGEPRGLLPHTFSLTPPPNFGVLPSGSMSPVEDERCTGFVLVTRAIARVFLSGIKLYRKWILQPSRFIYEMGLIGNE